MFGPRWNGCAECRRFYHPLFRRSTLHPPLFSDAAGRIESGELGVTVPMQGDDELGHLGRAFSDMSLRLEELIRERRTFSEESLQAAVLYSTEPDEGDDPEIWRGIKIEKVIKKLTELQEGSSRRRSNDYE